MDRNHDEDNVRVVVKYLLSPRGTPGLLMLSGMGVLWLGQAFKNDIDANNYSLFLAIGFFGAVFGALGLIFQYLQTGFSRRNQPAEDVALQRLSAVVDELVNSHAQLAARFSQGASSQVEQSISDVVMGSRPRSPLTPDQRAGLVEEVRSFINAEAAGDLLAKLREDLASQQEHLRKDLFEVRAESVSARLRKELASLERRGNVNLVLGGAATLVGLGLLGYFVVGANVDMRSVPSLLAHYLPRITLVLFIQVFAYFFLKLYKASLLDIKYYQNELTSHESRVLAVAPTSPRFQ